MAHYATKKFDYWRQLGILTAFCGGGLILGGLLSIIPLIGSVNLADFFSSSSDKIIKDLLVPANANIFRAMQFLSTLCLFFLPAFFYAWICHIKPFKSLGFEHTVDIKQGGIVVAIMLAALPVAGTLQEITEMLPFSKATLLEFKAAEDAYNQQVAVMARMNNFSDYIISVIIIALLPAIFEEVLFRGALQNLFSRWFKLPILAIVITSILFSAIHGSYLGFLSRFALSFILGWIYYRTGNIWLNIIGHFANNAFAVTALYGISKAGEKLDPSKINEHYPLWLGAIGIAILYGLFLIFEKVSKKDINLPGREVLISYNNNHLANNVEHIGNNHH